MSSFGTYLVGFIILIFGLGLAAYLLNVPSMWIAVGAIILVGIGVLSATTPPPPPLSSSRQGASGRLFGVLIHQGPPVGRNRPKRPTLAA